jgi:outer membrane receptor protein involved in Fe transport
MRRETDLPSGMSTVVRSRFPDHSSMDSLAAYVSADWQTAERWTLGSGLRYSRFDINLAETTSSAGADLNPADLTGDFRFVYTINQNTRLVSNLGRGFRPPNIFDLGTLGNRPGNRYNIANPGLQPEYVHSYDLGLKSQSDQWQSELFVFLLDYRDKITSVATGDVTENGRVVVRSENLSEATLYGVEAGFRWISSDQFEWYGTLNHTRGEEQTAAKTHPADRVPPLNGKIGAVFNPAEHLSIDAFVLFAGSQDRLSPRDLGDPRISPQGTPGWGTLNVTMTWIASETLELGLRLENLADKAYREHASGIDAPGLNFGAWATLSF